jgi:hypothetical protein
MATVAGSFTAFWLKFLDSWLLGRPAALDAASAFYFLGRSQPRALPDRETISAYGGAQRDVV